jgi:hypothetical protein
LKAPNCASLDANPLPSPCFAAESVFLGAAFLSFDTSDILQPVEAKLTHEPVKQKTAILASPNSGNNLKLHWPKCILERNWFN